MKKNREYIESMIAVLEYSISNKRISNKAGENMAGKLWCNVKNELSKDGILYVDFANDTNLISTHKLEVKLNEYNIMLKEAEKEEYDRELDNRSKKLSYRLAVFSIIISILASTGLTQQIFQWIYEQLKELFCSLTN